MASDWLAAVIRSHVRKFLWVHIISNRNHFTDANPDRETMWMWTKSKSKSGFSSAESNAKSSSGLCQIKYEYYTLTPQLWIQWSCLGSLVVSSSRIGFWKKTAKGMRSISKSSGLASGLIKPCLRLCNIMALCVVLKLNVALSLTLVLKLFN